MKKNIKQLLAGALLLPVMVLGASFFTTALQPAPAVHAAFDKGMMDGANSAQGKNQQGDAATLFGEGGEGGDSGAEQRDTQIGTEDPDADTKVEPAEQQDQDESARDNVEQTPAE